MRCRWHFLGAAFAIAALPGALDAETTAEPTYEYKVKAAFLLNFARYAKWPADATEQVHGEIIFCVLGPDPFGGALERTVSGRNVGGRPLSIKKFSAPDPMLNACRVAFVGKQDLSKENAWLAALRDLPVLTVGESADFLERGGVIRFVVATSVKFEVNLDAARHAGLSLGSRLLPFASRIYSAKP